jgi:hypothetical protein
MTRLPSIVPIAATLLVAAWSATGLGGAQSVSAPAKATRPWTPPRTTAGQPDLQGVWNYSGWTPLERPPAYAGREFLTDEELAQADKTLGGNSSDRRDGVGTPADVGRENNEFWLERRKTILTRRTSLIVDPTDGRLPPLTDEGERTRTARTAYLRKHPADSWEDRRLNERCILYLQSGPPIIPIGGPGVEILAGVPYHFQIIQTPDYVVIRHEELSVRIVPLDGRPHLANSIPQWLGDSRGHWEGNTLTIETSNFREGRLYAGALTTKQLRLIERFTRVDTATIDYRFTVDDPTTWTKPWSATVPIAKTDGRLYEFACHEGNYSLPHMLSGARAEEKAAASQPAR